MANLRNVLERVGDLDGSRTLGAALDEAIGRLQRSAHLGTICRLRAAVPFLLEDRARLNFQEASGGPSRTDIDRRRGILE